MDQRKMINDNLEKLNLQDANPCVTPISKSHYKQHQDIDGQVPLNEGEHKQYRSMVGALVYIALGTRPDIAYGTIVSLQRPFLKHRLMGWNIRPLDASLLCCPRAGLLVRPRAGGSRGFEEVGLIIELVNIGAINEPLTRCLLSSPPPCQCPRPRCRCPRPRCRCHRPRCRCPRPRCRCPRPSPRWTPRWTRPQ